MEKLKPCPFCGGEAVIETFSTAMEKKPRFRARCQSCWCETNWDFWAAEDAITAWNTRKDAERLGGIETETEGEDGQSGNLA